MESIQNTYIIRGMHCQACRKRIEKRLGKIDGVDTIDVNEKTGITAIHAPRPISKDEIAAALTGTEYTVEDRN